MRAVATAKKGFTLIELLIVVVIIGILAAVAIPKFSNTKEKAAKSSAIADLRNLATAQESFFADSNRYGVWPADTLNGLRWQPSRANNNTTTPPVITATATNWTAVITIPGGKKCAMIVGPGATTPAGYTAPPALLDGEPACSDVTPAP